MSLRQDLDKIAETEGFESSKEFVNQFLVKENRTFYELKEYLEKKYRRHYSWEWVYIHCSKMVPDYKVSKRCRATDTSGITDCAIKKYWQGKCEDVGFISLNDAFSTWKGTVAALAVNMDVNYTTLYSRHVKWKRQKGRSLNGK